MRSWGKNPIKEVNEMSAAIAENKFGAENKFSAESKFSFEETFELVKGQDLEQTMRDFAGRMQIYRAGIKEIRTKLEILDEEFQTKFSYNPIHHIRIEA